MSRSIVYFDIEADGLYEKATKVHCLALSVNGETPQLFVGEDIPQGLEILASASAIVAHNGIGYDLPMLFRFFKFSVPEGVRIVDTLLVSKLLDPDSMEGHALEVLGEKVGVLKMDYEARWHELYGSGNPWQEYCDLMGVYCQQDVNTLIAVSRGLSCQTIEDKEINWVPSMKLEHEFAKVFAVQGMRGVYVNAPLAISHVREWDEEMQRIASEVEPLLPKIAPTKAFLNSVTPPKIQFLKNGAPSAKVRKWFDKVSEVDGIIYGEKFGQDFKLPHHEPLITEVPMKLHNQVELKNWLMDCGWIPTIWSYKKSKDKNGKMRVVRGDDGQPIKLHPKFHEKGVLCPGLDLISDQFPLAKRVVQWVVTRHRRGLVQGVLENLREDSTVPATGMSLGTPTSRVTHSVVANVPKAEKEVYLGKECREIFTARPGRVLVGADASGLELRMLCHRAPSDMLRHAVISGTKENGDDIHSILFKACDGLVRDRTIQKNVNYGWLYGASDPKLGITALHPEKDAAKAGMRIREALVASLPGLDELMEACERAAKRGYIVALDGRRIPIRSKHATLNTLLQSDGSIVVKYATVWAAKEMRRRKLRAFQVIHYHDEVQYDSHPDDAEEAGSLFVQGLKEAEKHFSVRCPLDGEVKVGDNWSQTH